jgi:hypothetical protein
MKDLKCFVMAITTILHLSVRLYMDLDINFIL